MNAGDHARTGGSIASTPVARVVVPTDTDPRRLTAVRLAADVAVRLDAALEVLSVAPADDVTKRDADIDDQLREAGVAAGRNVVAGRHVSASVQRVVGRSDTLVCMPTRGRSAVAELFSRGIAADVMRHAHHPVLVIGPACGERLSGSRMAITVDGSEESETIVGPSVRLAYQLDLRPMLYQVIAEGAHDARDSAYVARVAAEHSEPDHPVQFDVLQRDHAGDALRQLATEPDIAIVAMASHAVSPADRLLIPSITHGVVRDARCPVLVGRRRMIGDDHPPSVGHPLVVVGVHDLPADERALDVAIAEASNRRATLEIVHCYSTRWVGSPEGVVPTESDEQARERAGRIVAEALDHVRRADPDLPTAVWLTEQLPYKALPAAGADADVVVVGEYKIGRVEEALFGHLSDVVVSSSATPVIVVPEPRPR
jgi:nucleotide-binding universal stress UspA family protein